MRRRRWHDAGTGARRRQSAGRATGSASALNDATCALQYALTDTPLLTGVDPILAQQWHLNNDGTVTGSTGEDVRAFAAWSRTKGEGVRIAVIDDAVEVTHQ